MEYRTLPHGGEKISVIGLGAGGLHNAPADEIERTVEAAIEAGVNHSDYVTTNEAPFEPMARAIGRHRADVYVQVHLGADYRNHGYAWTTDPKATIAEFEACLATLRTDYADFGLIHCIDEDADLDRVMNGGVWDYALKQKQAGVIRHLGFSTHNVRIAPVSCHRLDGPRHVQSESHVLLHRRVGVRLRRGVRSTKPISRIRAGWCWHLRYEAACGRPVARCASVAVWPGADANAVIQYALDRAGVLTVLPGVRGMDDLEQILEYVDATPEERDYAALADMAPESRAASCMYCNHCQPCPVGIQIGLVNKYYDLACLGDKLAEEHYRNLEHHAGECIACGHCDTRCPFGVAQSARMAEIAARFGA